MMPVGIPRALDDLGRLVIAKEFRQLMGLGPGAQLLHTLVSDKETGRLRGVLLQPLDWVIDPESAPRLADVLRQRKEEDDR